MPALYDSSCANRGGGRESNPPGNSHPLAGFEDREGHQPLFASKYRLIHHGAKGRLTSPAKKPRSSGRRNRPKEARRERRSQWRCWLLVSLPWSRS